MNLRFAGMITGCMLVGAGAAAYHRADSRPAPTGAALAAATPDLPTPLFLQAATGAPAAAAAAWPPVTSVAFYEQMFEQLPAATAPVTPAQAETPPAAATRPPASPRVIPLPRAPQTLPALNTSGGGAGVPQIPARGTNVGTAGGQQTLPPVRDAQTPPVRTANAATGGAQTPPPPGNTSVAAGGTQTPAVDSNAGNGEEPTPQRAGATPPRERADMVEIVIRDRFGRPVRVERVDRRRLAAARAHQPPPPYRFYHSYPQGPHGGHGGYGPYGLHR